MISLSVLDQSPIRSGATPADAVAETLELARLADRLGYRRYWLAEHHSTGGLAGSTPEILIGRVASVTDRIRVGSGGVMLSHYSPLKVAENFRMLETLYPGRIDLGIGRAPGSDSRTAQALQAGPQSYGIDQFPRQIHDLMGYVHGELPADHPFASVRAEPVGPSAPEFWLLGSSDVSASFAAHFGCAFSFAHFINAQGGEMVMEAYRQHFSPSPFLDKPLGNIGVFVVCADTEAEAERLASTRDLWILRLRTGRPGPVPSPEEALSYPYTDAERAFVAEARKRTIAGNPDQVKAKLSALAEAYGVEELVVVTICHDFGARARSYELLAQAFELTERS
ncbi:MAG: LLM class flavin-dependent oxidoreductase [Rhodospirillaceae bacterium]|nr:LLM class flavin-dependent oxidoreductase [Rhodospirillaceae bacterium]